MLKQITTGFALMLSAIAFSQVGIQTENPQATLDVAGTPTDITKLDGIIAPRIEGAQLRAKTYTADQTGALIYVTLPDTSPAGQTIDVTAAGYYYFNGTKWVMAGAGDMVNIYNSDGSLNSQRQVNLNGNWIYFQGSEGNTSIEESGASIRVNAEGADRAQLRLFTEDLDGDGVGSNFDIDLFTDNILQMLGNDQVEGIVFGTHSTKNSSPIDFTTSAGAFADGEIRMKITGEGNVGIQTTVPTERFDNGGITRLRELPLNGATNAHHTTSGGGESPSKDQTFTATRTLVADANGVVGYVSGLPAASVNIYNSEGTFTANRTATIPSGQWLNFAGPGYVGIGGVNPIAKLNVNGFIQFGPADSHYGVGKVYDDANGQKYGLTQSTYFPAAGDARSPGTRIYTSGAPGVKGHISFGNYTSPTVYTEWGRFGHATGNFGINTINGSGSNNPTEKLDVNGNARFRTLPLNGATNAIFTQSNGTASSTQNQTFTATRTLVADVNGVVGYVDGIPTAPGVPKVVVSAGALGTQNIRNANKLLANYPNEFIDIYSAWTTNVFTVPAGQAGVYIFNMQNSNLHDVNAQVNWFTMALLEKSTDGGTTWTTIMKDTNSGLAGTDVDNGNAINWTGNLNVGDKIRLLYHCDSTANNIVTLGSLTITKLAQ